MIVLQVTGVSYVKRYEWDKMFINGLHTTFKTLWAYDQSGQPVEDHCRRNVERKEKD